MGRHPLEKLTIERLRYASSGFAGMAAGKEGF